MAAKKQRQTRGARLAALQMAASQVEVPERCDVCVVGGGAAGLVAAIVAAEKGARVVVIERDLECGRTILATGNGRCNFANTQLDSSRYHEAAFVANVCGDSWLQDVLAFFEDCGLAWAEESEGRLYPISRQAASVRNVLLCRASRAGVTLAPAREVQEVRPSANGVAIAWYDLFGPQANHELHASAVVFATGSANRLVSDHLGLASHPFVPMLCPIACTGPALAALDGRRVRAEATLLRDGDTVVAEKGEVLFRDYGLSGIAVFNLSRYAQRGDEIRLDLLPGLAMEDATPLARHTLDGLLDPVVAKELLTEAATPIEALRLAKRLSYTVEDLTQTEKAQVKRGGLTTSQFSPTTLEAIAAPHVFACGEALDVDGPCGGFNLAWAWKSGVVAGAAAAEAAAGASNTVAGRVRP